MTSRATAPGKIMIAGEYAVLDGGRAVLMAVNRRVVATLVDSPPEPSPFITAVIDELVRRNLDTARACALSVDSGALRDPSGVKLGLGSSAAVTVAATALALGPELVSASIVHDIAHRAHRNAQSLRGDPGSGADVAASVRGGVVSVQRAACADDPMHIEALPLPPAVHLVPVWTGIAADTAPLVAAVRAAATARPRQHQRALADIADAADALAGALRSGDAAAVVAAVDSGGRATRALGQLSGLVLSGQIHDRIENSAKQHGGAAKPTGAGAGDIALAAFTDPQSARQFRNHMQSDGMLCPDLGVDESGVDFS